MVKIKKGDQIMVISGKDKGKAGAVEQVFPSEAKVVVTGVNINKLHLKPSRKNPHGGIMTMPKPIQASNVMLVCPHCSRPVRVAYKVTGEVKERVCRKCQGNLDMVATKVTTKSTSKKEKAKIEEKDQNVQS